jgi:GNAT superfamily N-acetyltransferase
MGGAVGPRAGGPGDVPLLMRHRRLMSEEIRREDGRLPFSDDILDEWDAASEAYVRRTMAEGDTRGWVVEADGGVVASAIASVLRVPPRPRDPAGLIVYVYGLYTQPQHRRRGLARALVQAAVEWARERGATRVELGASQAGRPLYASMGFVDAHVMRLMLE